VGVVLAGAGARGAYEAGALAVLLPELDRRGQRPTIFVGTSAGAINAVLFASLAHRPASEAAQAALAVWQSMRKPAVLRPAWQTLPMALVRYAARLAALPVPLPGLLDTAPLHDSLRSPDLLDWAQLHANVLDGAVEAVSVVTTELGSNRTKVFFESASRHLSKEPPQSDSGRAIDYSLTTLTPEHVLASAAIPALFPPVRLGPEQDSSWHMDGGVRLNTPLKPALALQARRLVIVATDPARYLTSPHQQAAGPAPTVQDAIDQIMHGYAAEGMIADLWNLIHINKILTAAGQRSVLNPAPKPGEDPAYARLVPFVFAGPPVSAELGGTAAVALAESLQGLRALLNPDLAMLRLLLSSGMRTRADLISYIFFEPEFIDAAIAQGQADARLLVQQEPFWRSEL
jgi:NTE family protein